MGLDMYLYRKTYVKNWDHNPAEKRFEITVKQGGKPFKAINPERINYITEEVGYWRKANAIHRWFVENVQDGKDDCGEYYVSREQLTSLRDLCLRVLEATKLEAGKVHNGDRSTKEGGWEPVYEDGGIIADPIKAKELLPTASGFFFGSTDYDQYYVQDIRETSDMLTALLAEPEEGDFIYRASW